MTKDQAEFRVATGPEDPRLCEVDDGFREVLLALNFMPKVSRVERKRFFHRNATTARGVFEILDDPDIPSHDFFRPGRRWPMIARFGNTNANDDACPDMRGVAIRLLDPDAPQDLTRGSFDLTLNTGDRFLAANAEMFGQYYGTPEQREALVAQVPTLLPTIWSMFCRATSFAQYPYYSQVPRCFVAADGTQWLVRFRLVPEGEPVETGEYQPSADRVYPPEPPDFIVRESEDDRPLTFLHDALRERVLNGDLSSLLQVQLHPVTDSPEANEHALNPMLRWAEADCPWRNLGRMHLGSLVDPADVEALQFNPGRAPASLGIPIARASHESASINHLRALIYRMASAARSGQPIPSEIEELLRARAPRVIERPIDQAVNGARTVCVLGAGVSGLTIARELERRGHRAIVLESGADVGGKCGSITVDGRAYDLGGHVCTSRYEQLAELITETDTKTEEATPSLVYTVAEGRSVPQSGAFFRRGPFRRYAELRSRQFSTIADPGLAGSARELAQSVGSWLADNGVAELAESLGSGYTASGFGHLSNDIPALYFVKYAEMTGLLSSRPEILGYPGAFTIAGGFQVLWDKVAAELSDLRTNSPVSHIERLATGVRVHVGTERIEADSLISTLPFDQVLPFLEGSNEERDLANRVRYMDYFTTVCRISGLPRDGFYLLEEATRSAGPSGQCVSFHNRYSDTDVYTCYSYGGPDVDEETILTELRAAVGNMGGSVEEVFTQRRWKFFPHFGSDDIRDGAYDRIESLQGNNNTFYAGSLPAFELVECNIAYARSLVDRFFQQIAEVGSASVSVKAATVDQPVRARDREPVTEAVLREWLIRHVATEVQIPEDLIDSAAPLELFPLQSLSLAVLQAELSDWLGWRVPHTLFLECPTLNAVARWLADAERAAGLADSAEPSVAQHGSAVMVPLQPVRPFFFVGGAVGSVQYALPLARRIGSDIAFYGLQAAVGDSETEPPNTVEEQAACYVGELRRLQPRGPYVVGGHSFGGLVAYEMARQLQAAGEEVSGVVVIDTYVPLADQPLPPSDDFAAMGELLRMHSLMFSREAVPDQAIDPMMSPAEQRARLGAALGAGGAASLDQHLAAMLTSYQANLEAIVRYQPVPAGLAVTLVKASGGFPTVMEGERDVKLHLGSPTNGWETCGVRELSVIHVPGDHFSMFSDPYLDTVATVMRDRLATILRTPAGSAAVHAITPLPSPRVPNELLSKGVTHGR